MPAHALDATPGDRRTGGSSVGDSKPTFVSIQILRGVAAAMVVLYHGFTALAGDPALQAWLFRALEPLECGVDLFFIVSGFVLAAATDGPRPPTAWAFLTHRAMRIFPLYWVACLIYLPSAMLSTGLGSQAPDALSLIASFFLLPQEHRLIAQSWTLTHEWQFYAVVALCLALGIRRHLAAVLAVLSVVGLAQEATGTRLASDTIVSVYMAEFLLGLLLYQARHRLWAWLSPRRAAGAVAIGIGILVVEMATQAQAGHAVPRLISSGGPALLIAAGAVAAEASLSAGRHRPLGRFAGCLGDTSYSIYLFHLCVLGGLGTALAALDLRDPGLLLAAAAGAIVVATGFGVVVGSAIELPLLKRTKAWRAAGRRAPVSAPAE